PVGTFLALDHDDNFMEQTRWSPWGSLFNVAQLPAISVPWTVDSQAPVGVQVRSITLTDAELLHLASILHATGVVPSCAFCIPRSASVQRFPLSRPFPLAVPACAPCCAWRIPCCIPHR